MSWKKNLKFRLINNPVTVFLVYELIHLYFKTIRFTFQNTEPFIQILDSGGAVIFASWHQRFFGGFVGPRFFHRPFYIMISKSRDGDFVSAVVRRFGWIGVRGSRSLGGKEALAEMVQKIQEHRCAAHIVDGPTGPPRVIKPGLISLAQKTGAAISLGFVFYEKAWIFNSWDRFMIPKPFSSVLIRVGNPETIPETLSPEAFESVRAGIERRMIEGYERMENYWSSAAKSNGNIPASNSDLSFK